MAVTKDKNIKTNPWYFTIELETDGERERIKRRGFKTQKEAKDALRDLLNQRDKGLNLKSPKIPLSDLLHEWLRGKLKIGKGTRATYTWLIDDHIIPCLGDKLVGELTSREIENTYIEWQETKRLCGDNLRKCHTLIKASLKRAVGLGTIVRNPADYVETPEAEEVEMLYWTPEESHRFLNFAVKDRYYMAFFLAITTGMRQGEILGMTETSTNLVARTLAVKQILEHDGKEIDQRTKSKSGIRSVGIDKFTAAKLEILFFRTKEEKMRNRDIYEDNDLVICTTLGTPLSPRNLNRSFTRLVNSLNKNLKENELPLKKIRFHDLRHSHVVALLMMRENNKRIAERMGWASVKMLDKYAHISPNMQQDTADAFGDMFFAGQEETEGKLVPKLVPNAK